MRRRQRAARSSVRTAEQRRSRYMGCNRGNAQPTAAHALQGKRKAWAVGCDEDSAQPTAVAEQRSSSYHSEATRQCVAHSGARIAEQRNSWVCATKATRSPQRRTRRIATKFIDPCLPRDAILSLYWFYWLRTLYVIQ